MLTKRFNFTLGIFSHINDVKIDDVPYAVLVGDAGSGKSTIVEKLTLETGRSGRDSLSFTKSSEYFWVPDKSLVISDTPGANPIKDKLEQNTQIAAAFNLAKVSKIFIVVTATTRIDSTVDGVRKYSDRFVSLPLNSVSVIVTHMDQVYWEKEECLQFFSSELGMEDAVFSGTKTTHEDLLSQVLRVCGTEKFDLSVDGESFLRLFKIHNNNRRILKVTSDEVALFKKLKADFEELKDAFEDKDLVDLYFEFQSFMGKETIKAQQRMADKLDFDFSGPDADNQSGHVANMVNQLRAVLYDIRVAALGFQNGHGCDDLRKCQHCGKVWAKVEGCDGGTTCGKRPSNKLDIRNENFKILTAFLFNIADDGKLQVRKNGSREVATKDLDENLTYGCGKTITWKEMTRVAVPEEFQITQGVSTNDVSLFPRASKVISKIDGMIQESTKQMKQATINCI